MICHNSQLYLPAAVAVFQVQPEAARQFLCDALHSAVAAASVSRGDAAVPHLLLEAAPTNQPASAPPLTAPRLFTSCCCVHYARLAVKVIAAATGPGVASAMSASLCTQFCTLVHPWSLVPGQPALLMLTTMHTLMHTLMHGLVQVVMHITQHVLMHILMHMFVTAASSISKSLFEYRWHRCFQCSGVM